MQLKRKAEWSTLATHASIYIRECNRHEKKGRACDFRHAYPVLEEAKAWLSHNESLVSTSTTTKTGGSQPGASLSI